MIEELPAIVWAVQEFLGRFVQRKWAHLDDGFGIDKPMRPGTLNPYR